MFGDRISTHQKAAAEAAGRARAIAEKAAAEGRELTAAERTEYDAKMAEGRRELELLKQAKSDAGIMADAKALFGEVGGFRKAGSGESWAAKAGEAVRGSLVVEAGGQKALVTGTVGVPAPIETDVVTIPEEATSILDLIPSRPLGGGNGFGAGNSFSFLRQTARTNNAAPVADGAVKPTSIFTLEEIEDRVRVIAHLSEPVPERYFADFANLLDFLRSEMEAGIRSALQTQVLSGDGTGENLTGILSTSGVVSVAFATDVLTTIRKGLTALQSTGVTPNALVMNPTDLEALDLLREDGTTGGFLLGDPAGAAAASVWRIPRVPSTEVAEGTAVLADWNQSEIVVREGATLALDRSGDNFTKNLVTARVEGRFGFAVKRPGSFAVLDLTAV